MSDTNGQSPVIYLRPVPAKRYAVLIMLYLLAGILAWVAVFQAPESLFWVVFLWTFALCILLLANAAGKATASGLQLRDMALYTDAGELLVRLEDVRKIDRGVFAIKPSNGFLLRLKARQPGGWAPGMWWRLGRVMGIGGVTSKIQAEIMAETIAALLERDTQR
ncbi:MAG: hypothetical protein QNI90_09335 [Dinoroseobacter sp.]|nr:hypothetical protein [Dinoroseobacter sp.]MDJ0993764.1 hypothetical protein [Dinoroseobacter sp.]